MNLTHLITPAPWMADAACTGIDTNVFYPAGSNPGDVEPARTICRGCTVRADCLLYALNGGEVHGVWGGLTPEERAKHRKRGRAS